MMGFDGTSVTPHIKELIEKHYVGNLLLTAKNLKCKMHMIRLHMPFCLQSFLTLSSGRGYNEALL
jgi:hypothetical protein